MMSLLAEIPTDLLLDPHGMADDLLVGPADQGVLNPWLWAQHRALFGSRDSPWANLVFDYRRKSHLYQIQEDGTVRAACGTSSFSGRPLHEAVSFYGARPCRICERMPISPTYEHGFQPPTVLLRMLTSTDRALRDQGREMMLALRRLNWAVSAWNSTALAWTVLDDWDPKLETVHRGCTLSIQDYARLITCEDALSTARCYLQAHLFRSGISAQPHESGFVIVQYRDTIRTLIPEAAKQTMRMVPSVG